MGFFADLGGVTITRRRFAAGTWDTNGRHDPGSPTNTSLEASVQPAGPRALQMLPEGSRTRDPREVFTESELLPASAHDGTQGDYLQISSVWYRVVASEVQPDIGLPRYRAVAVRLQEGETVPS